MGAMDHRETDSGICIWCHDRWPCQTAQIRRFGGPCFTTVPTDLFARHIRALWTRAEREGIPDASAWDRDVPEVKETVPIRF